jgi:hypothetical protein
MGLGRHVCKPARFFSRELKAYRFIYEPGMTFVEPLIAALSNNQAEVLPFRHSHIVMLGGFARVSRLACQRSIFVHNK